MKDLISRFESPIATRRWDNPLFEVAPEGTLDLEALREALLHGKAPKASMATEVVSLSDQDFY